MQRITIAILCLVLTACGATGGSFVKLDAPPEKNARVYIYRPAKFAQSGVFPTLKLNQNELGDLKNGGFLTFLAPAGQHTLNIGGSFFQWGHGESNYTFRVEAGQTYFFKLDPTMRGDGKRLIVGYGFFPVSESMAIQELQEMKESK